MIKKKREKLKPSKYRFVGLNRKNNIYIVIIHGERLGQAKSDEEALELIKEHFKNKGEPVPDLTRKADILPLEELPKPKIRFTFLNVQKKAYTVRIQGQHIGTVHSEEGARKLIEDYFKSIGESVPDLNKTIETRGRKPKNVDGPKLPEPKTKYCSLNYSKTEIITVINFKKDDQIIYGRETFKSEEEAKKWIIKFFKEHNQPIPDLEKKEAQRFDYELDQEQLKTVRVESASNAPKVIFKNDGTIIFEGKNFNNLKENIEFLKTDPDWRKIWDHTFKHIKNLKVKKKLRHIDKPIWNHSGKIIGAPLNTTLEKVRAGEIPNLIHSTFKGNGKISCAIEMKKLKTPSRIFYNLNEAKKWIKNQYIENGIPLPESFKRFSEEELLGK